MSSRNTSSNAYDAELSRIFAQLTPDAVEQFYQGYQQWWYQQQLLALQNRIGALKLQLRENEAAIHCLQPSPIALATLARLQSYGVTDLDLLDRMLQRGDEWLDRTMQLLEQCEHMGIIRDDYTHWCIHALEDAYDWIASISEEDTQTQPELLSSNPSATMQGCAPQGLEIVEETESVTEEQFLQRLMSEADEETVKMPAFRPGRKSVSNTVSNNAQAQPETPEATPNTVTIATPSIPIPSLLSYPFDPARLLPIQKTPVSSTETDSTHIPATSTSPIPIPGLLSYPFDPARLLPTPETPSSPLAAEDEEQDTPSSSENDNSLPPAIPSIALAVETNLPPSADISVSSPQVISPTVIPSMQTQPVEEQMQPLRQPQEQQRTPRKRGLLSKFLASLWSD